MYNLQSTIYNVPFFRVQNYKDFLEYAKKACFYCYFNKNSTGIYEENYKFICIYAKKIVSLHAFYAK